SAIAVGVGTLATSFVLRGTIRFLWHRLTPVATGVVVGPAVVADLIARRVSTHPEARPARELPRLGSIADISRIAREHAIERVVVIEHEMGEAAAERLIEECK